MATINVNPGDNIYNRINSANAGDVVQFSSGVFEVKNMNQSTITASGSAGNPIIVRGQEDFSTTILDSGGSSGNLFGLNCDHIVFEYLKLSYPNTSSEGNPRTDRNSTSVTRNGFNIDGGDDITLRKLYFKDISKSGFLCKDNSRDITNFVVELCIVDNVGGDTAGGDFRVNGGTGPFLVRRNLMSGNVDGCVNDGSPKANQIIEENICMNHFREDHLDIKRSNKNCTAPNPTVMRNNILYLNRTDQTGITFQNNSCWIEIYDNIIYGDYIIPGKTRCRGAEPPNGCPAYAGIWFHARYKNQDRQNVRNAHCHDNVLIGPDHPQDAGIFTSRSSDRPVSFENILIEDNILANYDNPLDISYSTGVTVRNNTIYNNASDIPAARLQYFTDLEWSIQNELEGIFPRAFFEESYQWAGIPYTPTGSSPPTEPPPEPPPDPPPTETEDITEIDAWQYGFDRTISAGQKRIATICIGIEANTPVVTNLRWGGQTVNTLFDEPVTGAVGSTDNRLYVGYLEESQIAAMVDGIIAHDGTTIDSCLTAAYANVDQTDVIEDSCNGKIAGGGTNVQCSGSISCDIDRFAIQCANTGTEGATVSVTQDFTLQIDDSKFSQATSVATKDIGTALASVSASHQWSTSSSRRIIYAFTLKPAAAAQMMINDLFHGEHNLRINQNIIIPTYKTFQVDQWNIGPERTPNQDPIFLNRVALVAIFERRLIAIGGITDVHWDFQKVNELYNGEVTDATYRYIVWVGYINQDQIDLIIPEIPGEAADITVDGADPTGQVFTATFANCAQSDPAEDSCFDTETFEFDDYIACPTAVRSRDKSHMFQFGLNEKTGISVIEAPAGFIGQTTTDLGGIHQTISQLEPIQ